MRYLIFDLDKQNYCIPMNIVREAITINKITKVPLLPDYIEGLVNLRGELIPIVNLKIRLGYKGNYDQFSKIIILNGEKPFGIMVDKVKGILNEIDSKIESESNFVESLLKYKNKDYILLDINKIIQIKKAKVSDVKISKNLKKEFEKRKLKKIMIFKLNNENYGFMISDVQEIINYVAPNKIPKVPHYIKGIISLRDEVLPVIDLNTYFYDKESIITEYTKLIIIKSNGIKAALIIDKLNVLMEVHDVKKIPFAIKENTSFKGYIKYKDLSVIVLDTEFILNENIKLLNKKNESFKKQNIKEYKNDKKYILFELDDEKYTLEMNSIVEIGKIDKITKVPYSKNYVRGVMNFRGEIIPIIDLKKRFGWKKNTDITEKSRLIIASVVTQKTGIFKIGFLVDRIKGIIQMDLIEFESNNEFVRGAGDYNGETALIIDLKKVFNKNEIIELNKNMSAIKNKKS
ncbi:hypothetical protein JCM30566_08910 [Marinitoga arctica]